MAVDTSFLRNTNAGINEQLMTAQQQLALAQALRGQSLQPIQVPSGQNGRISPLSVLAQALNGYTANGKMQGATHDLAGAQAAQAQNQWAMMAKMLNPDPDQPSPPPAPASTAPAAGATAPGQDAGPALSSTPQASIPGVSTPSATASPGVPPPSTPSAAPGGAAPFAAQDPRTDPRYRQMAMAEQLGVLPQGSAAAYAKAKYDYAAPTPEQKNANDPTIGSSVQSNLATQNMTDLQRLQRARALLPPNSPQVKEIDDQIAKLSYVAPKDVAPGVLTLDKHNKPLAYNPPAIRGAVPQFQTRDGFTTAPSVTPQRGAAAVNANMEGAEQGAREARTIKTVPGPDGKQITNWGGNVVGTVSADPTIQTARTNQQNNLADKWKPLNEAVSNAQTINSRLDTIQELATRASTGQFADKLQYVNSLLSMAGSEKATDATTAKALLDKNANQIVALLGQGGLATDAARSIISSAYPNSHMPGPAIKEAAENLKAANAMQVAKAGVLQKHYLNNDPATYQQAESQFNAVADPRVFQWYSMHDPQQQAEYAKRMMAQDPTFRSKVEALTKLGALK